MFGCCLKQTNHVMHKPGLLVGSAAKTSFEDGNNCWLMSKNMFSSSKGKQALASKFTSFSELLKQENEKTLKERPLAAVNESLNQFSNVKMKFHNFSQNNAAEWSPFSQPYGNPDSNSYLQPSKTGLSINKLAKRLGFDMRDVANENVNQHRVKPTRSYIRDRNMENKEEEKPAVNEEPAQNEKQENRAEAENIQLVRGRKSQMKAPLTPIQQLMLKQKNVYIEPEQNIVQRNLLKRREDRAMHMREHHTSTMMFADKNNKENSKNNQNSKNDKNNEMRTAMKTVNENSNNKKNKKTDEHVVGRCRQKREKPPEVKFTYGFKCYEQNDPKRKLTKKKYHTSTNSTDTGLIPNVDKTGLEVSDLCVITKSKIAKTDI